MIRKILPILAISLIFAGCQKDISYVGLQTNSEPVVPDPILEITVNGQMFRMIYVAGGTFYMGSQANNLNGINYDAGASSDEAPVHSVTLDGYYIGETEVTQALWKAVMGEDNSSHGPWSAASGIGNTYPAYAVNYADVQSFVAQLNSLTGRTFDIPTEAEWEYAARGGNQSQGYKYSGSNKGTAVAWASSNSNDKAHLVQRRDPNELGIYDMSGNVEEWCSDWYGGYSSDPQTNPTGPSRGTHRVVRGGDFHNLISACRVACRTKEDPTARYGNFGFRLALSE